MNRSDPDTLLPFAPILSWDNIQEALAFVTEPEAKLLLIPAVMTHLKRAAQESGLAFALTLAVQISALSDKTYDLPRAADGGADMP